MPLRDDCNKYGRWVRASLGAAPSSPVHVDVGTQALAQGTYNASIGRAPVLLLARLSLITESGETPGSRTEYQHWLQDPQVQKLIVRQYYRYTEEFCSGLKVKQKVGRAFQFATSASKVQYISLVQEKSWRKRPSRIRLIRSIAVLLGRARFQMMRSMTSSRLSQKQRVHLFSLDILAATVGYQICLWPWLICSIRAQDTGGSDMRFPSSHIASEGYRLPRLSFDPSTKDVDAVLLIDCDVP